jgi:hypothetical protein
MIKHGATIGGTATPEWNAWANMKKRCLNSRNPKFKHYGGRGIRIDEKWLGGDGFIHFREDLGLRPSPTRHVFGFGDCETRIRAGCALHLWSICKDRVAGSSRSAS